METRQMKPFFSSTFSALTVSNIHFYTWKQLKFIFMLSCFGPFWSVKYLNFGPELPMWIAHHIFLEGRLPKVTKNPCYVLSPESFLYQLWTIEDNSERFEILRNTSFININKITVAFLFRFYSRIKIKNDFLKIFNISTWIIFQKKFF